MNRQIFLCCLHVGAERDSFLLSTLGVGLMKDKTHPSSSKSVFMSKMWVTTMNALQSYHNVGDQLCVRCLVFQCIQLGDALLLSHNSLLLLTPEFVKFALFVNHDMMMFVPQLTFSRQSNVPDIQHADTARARC